jgi:hypothetical protein
MCFVLGTWYFVLRTWCGGNSLSHSPQPLGWGSAIALSARNHFNGFKNGLHTAKLFLFLLLMFGARLA